VPLSRYDALPPRRPKIAPVPNVQTGSSAERIACWVVLGVGHRIDRQMSSASAPTVRATTVQKINLKSDKALTN
jgi:hypothetical protein